MGEREAGEGRKASVTERSEMEEGMEGPPEKGAHTGPGTCQNVLLTKPSGPGFERGGWG